MIVTCKTNSSPEGYFAALYRLVTIKVKEGIANDFFEDGPRMEQLDVVFANRYLTAFQSYHDQQLVTKSWKQAFDLSAQYWPIVIQHLLIGMNAHINLDLGIAAAQIMSDKDINKLQGDFNRINQVLSSLVQKVQIDLTEIWPMLKLVLRLTGKVDNFVTDFSMKLARDGAWKFAKALSEMPASKQAEFIQLRDLKVSDKSRLITNPGFLIGSCFKLVRLGERGTVAQKIVKMMD